MTASWTGNRGAVGRALVSIGLWVVTGVGALGTVFFVAMLLTPGYGDVVIAIFAGVATLLTLTAVAGLRWRGRGRRARESGVVADVRQGRVLEQVAPSRRRWTMTAVAAGALFVGAVVLVLDGAVGGLVLVGIFGVVLALSLVQLAPRASWLRVTTRGILTRHLGHTRAHRWEDIDDFRVYEVRTRYTTQRLVGWSVSERACADRRAARWLRWPSGVDDGLPTEYETDPEELAARLQRYRNRAARQDDGAAMPR